MMVDVKWMLVYLKLSRLHFYRLIKDDKIPKPYKAHRSHACWDSEEIIRLFPDGWRSLPLGCVDTKWMLEYFGLSRSYFYDLIKQGKIPYQNKLHAKKGYWIESEIRDKFPGGKYK